MRNDQPRDRTALQLALAIRDEVVALEQAGLKVIQVVRVYIGYWFITHGLEKV